LKLDLYRKCLNDANEALKIDKNSIRAYILKGKVLTLLEKRDQATQCFNLAESLISENTDIELFSEIKSFLSPSTSTIAPSHAQVETHRTIAPSFPIATEPPQSAHGIAPPSHELPGKHDVEPNPQNFALSTAQPNPTPDQMDILKASAAIAAKGMVQHGSGKAQIDEKIALGYLHVNTGRYKEGIQIFNAILSTDPKIIAGYLGRGTAFALQGELDQAILDFSTAIDIDPNCVDARKRRGQSRAALGMDKEALEDLTQSTEADPSDAENWHQRGLLYYKTRNYRRAFADFNKSIGIDHKNKHSWNHLALCFSALGRTSEALDAHKKALEIDPNFKEGYVNLAGAYKEMGNRDEAEKLYAKALAMDSKFSNCYYMRAMTRFASGEHKLALQDFSQSLAFEPGQKECRHMKGVVNHGLGNHRAAVMDYGVIVGSEPNHVAWYNREVCIYTHHKLDVRVSDFNMDMELNKYFKEGWCKKLHPQTLIGYTPLSQETGTGLKGFDVSIPDVVYKTKSQLSAEAQKIIDMTRVLGSKIQLNAAGYMPNKRQHRMCGLAALEMAQKLRKYWKGDITTESGSTSSFSTKEHPIMWRSVYDIVVKWRQFSEPNDPVWWVDLLSPEQFSEGFGSHTPMLSGQVHVMRYSPMVKRALKVIKPLIVSSKTLSEETKKKIMETKDCYALYILLKRDFWVVTPCHSIARPGAIMEGTRLTIQYMHPEGVEFSIRTPGTPPRWVEYDYEMNFIFNQLSNKVKTAWRNGTELDLDSCSDLILSLTFYWYNYMPLSRGTAAVGYICLLGMFLALGYEITEPVPKDQQVDWEGILRPTPQDFIDQLKDWMYPSRKEATWFDELGMVDDVFPTLRSRIEAMNAQ